MGGEIKIDTMARPFFDLFKLDVPVSKVERYPKTAHFRVLSIIAELVVESSDCLVDEIISAIAASGRDLLNRCLKVEILLEEPYRFKTDLAEMVADDLIDQITAELTDDSNLRTEIEAERLHRLGDLARMGITNDVFTPLVVAAFGALDLAISKPE